MATDTPKHVIASCIVACLRQLSSLLIRLTENETKFPDTDIQELYDEFQTFKIWCEIWGPYQPEEEPIDVKLRFFDSMRTNVAVSLVDLHKVLVDTANPKAAQDRVYLYNVMRSFSKYDPDKPAIVLDEPRSNHLGHRQAGDTDQNEVAFAIVSIRHHTHRLYALSSKFNSIAACPINTYCGNFLDFDGILPRIKQRLDDKTLQVALIGPAGLGKTTIATRFAQMMTSREQILILWIDASCHARIKQSYDMMGIPDQVGKEHSSHTSIRGIFDAIFSHLGIQKSR